MANKYINPNTKVLSPYFVGEVLFLSNFIGIVWARSIHQQYVIWYWFSLPYIMYSPLVNNKLGITELVLTMIMLDGTYVTQLLEEYTFATYIIHMYYFIFN